MTTPPAEVTATEFRNDIARIFRDAHYGHPITITNNGEPFVKLVHPDADEGELLARAEQAEAELADIQEQRASWKIKHARSEDTRREAEAKLIEVAKVKVWTNEDGQRFVFADDLAAILLPDLNTPAPTTRTETA